MSADHARRFLVRRQLLDPTRSLPAEPASVLRVVDRIGSLQFDPLEVPGARNHDLVLHARIADYRRGWDDEWLYGPLGSRRLIELYNKSLNLLPMTELPYYRLAWTRGARHYTEFLAQHRDLADRIRDHIRDYGPVSTAAFRDVDHRIDWWWDAGGSTTKAARALMEAMFVCGELGIARREGSRRYYDLIERLVPADLLAVHAPEAEQHRHRLLSRFRAVGLMAQGGNSELIASAGTAADRRRITAELVADGVLLPVEVEGLRDTRHVLAEEWPMAEATAETESASSARGVTFVAPLDPLIWDRRLVARLFGFEYTWEVYTPEAKRRHGYYVLPILFGDRLVGRIEPRRERRARALRMKGIWFENGFDPLAEPDFIPALADALRAYRAFVGADTVVWPRTRPGRDIAGALRRL